MTTKEKSAAALRLIENEDFAELILKDFIKEGLIRYTIEDNVRSEAVQDELIARRIVHEYFFGIITAGERPDVS